MKESYGRHGNMSACFLFYIAKDEIKQYFDEYMPINKYLTSE